MTGFDYTYYKESFGGGLSEAEFKRSAPVALDLTALLVGFDVSDSEDASVLRALCMQVDYTADSQGKGDGVRSESLGDYSVSYSEGVRPVSSLYGNEICPETVAALVACGLLTRWA